MSQQLVTLTQNNEAVTTSLAIAEGTEVEHASVILLVRNYISDIAEFGNVDFKSTSNPGQKRATEYAILNEDQATLLITYMRNSEIVRAFKKRLVREFRNMHNALQAQVPQTYKQALLALVEAEEVKEQLLLENSLKQQKIEEDAPKVKFYDKYMNAEGLITIRDAARCFNVQEEAFKSFLRLIKMIEKCTRKHAAMAEARKAGYMRYVPSTNSNGTLGTSYVTPLGMEHIEMRKERCRLRDPKTYSTIFDGNEW